MRNLLLLAATLIYTSVFSQDNIILKTGDEIKGSVIKVGTSEIEYKKDSLSPIYAIKKADVFMIKYANGTKDVLTNLATIETKKVNAVDLKLKYERHKRAGIGLLATGGVCIVAGSILAPFTRDGVSFFLGVSLIGASLPFLIAGGVEMHKYIKYKRQWKEEQRASLSFAPNGVRLNF